MIYHSWEIETLIKHIRGKIGFLFVWSISLWDKLPRAIILAQGYVENQVNLWKSMQQLLTPYWPTEVQSGPKTLLLLQTLNLDSKYSSVKQVMNKYLIHSKPLAKGTND